MEDKILKFFPQIDIMDLVKCSHEDGGAWDNVYKGEPHTPISKKDIIEYEVKRIGGGLQISGVTTEEKQNWAEAAKMRANKTAASYNEFMLKNTHIWEQNIPEDILEKLEYIGS